MDNLPLLPLSFLLGKGDNTRKQYTEAEKLAIWEKGKIYFLNGMPHSPSTHRVDAYGSLMLYFDYGNRKSEFGWEIDHDIPLGLAEIFKINLNTFANLRPLNWRNNAEKGMKLDPSSFVDSGTNYPLGYLMRNPNH